jgi:hypothetical protein
MVGFVQSGGPTTLHELRDRLSGGNTARLVVALACLGAVVVVGVFGTLSYRHHAGVQRRALTSLEKTVSAKASHKSKGTSPKNSSSPTGTVSPLSGVGSVSLPIGQVEASSPVAAASLPSFPLGGGSTTIASTPAGSAGGSGSSPPAATSEVDVAVLSPFLDTLQFGASVGFLLTCNTGAGAVSAAASQIPGLSQVLTPVLAEISPECGKLSAEAVSELNTFNQDLAALQGLTPASAPYFAALNKAFATLNTLAPDLQPLTATITALGPLVDFFSGGPASS